MRRIVLCLAILIMAIYFQPFSNTGEVSHQARFVTYANGTVIDTKTGLMWASKDNGSGVTWMEAKTYCENYYGAGYTDWRMPTITELAKLYDYHQPGYRPECAVYDWKIYITGSIHLTGCCAWASETRGCEASCFLFDYGCKTWMYQSVSLILRALPVRNCNVFEKKEETIRCDNL
jgi:hypothetical protein